MTIQDRPLLVLSGIDLACRVGLVIFFSLAIGMLGYAFLALGHVVKWIGAFL